MAEKVLENLNLQIFFNSLIEEDKVKFMTYVIDNVYKYEENDNEDEEQNEDILLFMRNNSKYVRIVQNNLKNEDSCNLKNEDSCNPKTSDQNDKHIEKLVEAFKLLRFNKLTRIINR